MIATAPRARYGALQQRVWSSEKYPRLLLFTCLFGMFATSFTFSVATVAFKPIAQDLHTTPGVVAWVVTAPALAAAVFLPIFGRLGDIQGHARVFTIWLTVNTVFNLLTAFAPNIALLIVFRTVAQLTGTATYPSTYAMLFRHYPPTERIRATSWAIATGTIAAVIGLVIGGPVISAFGWRPLFVAQAILGVLAIIPALIVLQPDERKRGVKMDWLGALALAATLFCFTFGINRVAANGPSPVPIALIIAAPFLSIALWQVERRARAPLLPVALVRNRQVQVLAGGTFLLSMCFQGSFVITPLLLQSLFGLSVTVTSLITACRTASIGLAAPFAGRIGVRFGARRTVIGGCAVITGGMLVLSLGADAKMLALVIFALVLTGFAYGHAAPASTSMMGDAVDPDSFGVGSALQQMSGQIGAVLGIGLFTAIAADADTSGPFATVFLIGAVLTGLVSVVFLTLARSAAPHHKMPDVLQAQALTGPAEL